MLNVIEPVDDEVDKVSLVARIVAGDRIAEDQLVKRYSRPVLFILRRRVRDNEIARDLHQETFITLLRRLRMGELIEPRALSGFVRQVALNTATQFHRKSVRQQTSTDHDFIEQVADESQTVLDALVHGEVQRQVRQSINAMSVPRDRELLLRFYVTDEDKSSICRSLGLSTDHFDRVLHRARQRLRELLPSGFGTFRRRSLGP